MIAVGTHAPRAAWTRYGASVVFFVREIALWLLIYPLYLLIADGAVAVMIFLRRRALPLPA